MKVSVVVPTYNRGPLLAEAIASALAQTHGDLEVVVVDDGSTDDTRERVAAIGDRRLRYLHQPNAGVSAARNRGLAAATAPLVAFLDSDDLWKPDKLAREVAFLRRHPDAAAVFTDVEKRDGDLVVPSFIAETPVFSRLVAGRPAADGLVLDRRRMQLCLLEEVPILPSAFTIRRPALDRTGHFDETWSSWEDWEFFLRLAAWACIGYLGRPLVVLRITGTSLHRLDAERGRSLMLRLLLRERRRLAGDAEAQAAIRRGLVRLRKHMGWHYLAAGRRRAALASYLRGYGETREAGLLVRAAATVLPRAWQVRAAARGRRAGA